MSTLQVETLISEDHKDHGAWLRARASGIGASEVAAVLGLNKYVSRYEVWSRKVRGEESLEENEAMRWGKLLEEPIAQEVGERARVELVDHGRFTMMRNSALPAPVFATLDRSIICKRRGPGVLEIKTHGAHVSTEDWQDEGPAPYVAQLQICLAITGCSWGLLAGLAGGQKLRIIEHQRDDDFLEWAWPRLRNFWKHVEERVPPPVAPDAATREALGNHWRDASGSTITLPTMAELWDAQRTRGKERIAEGEALVLEAENLIKGELKDSTIGHLPGGGLYRWTPVKPKPQTCPHCEKVVMERAGYRTLRKIQEG